MSLVYCDGLFPGLCTSQPHTTCMTHYLTKQTTIYSVGGQRGEKEVDMKERQAAGDQLFSRTIGELNSL